LFEELNERRNLTVIVSHTQPSLRRLRRRIHCRWGVAPVDTGASKAHRLRGQHPSNSLKMAPEPEDRMMETTESYLESILSSCRFHHSSSSA
jgi:hypothetical protein